MIADVNMVGQDIPIEKLVPLRERGIKLDKNPVFRRILASIKAIGLVEPLCVCQEGDVYNILDGFLRFMALKMLGVTMVPCMIFPDKEAYTYDRMVNPLSPVQERRMLLKSLQTIDRATIAEVFGVKSIAYRLAENVVKHLAPEVVKGVDQHLLTLRCAAEMTYVKVERQLEILAAMKERGDYSTACARTLVAQTTPSLRNPAKASRRVWTRRSEAKKALVTKLQEASKQYDFYTKSYHEYATDLLKLCSYVRKLVKNTKLRDYLEEKFPELLERFEEIIFDMKGV